MKRRDYPTLQLDTTSSKVQRIYSYSAFQSHSRVFNNYHDSYSKMSVSYVPVVS